MNRASLRATKNISYLYPVLTNMVGFLMANCDYHDHLRAINRDLRRNGKLYRRYSNASNIYLSNFKNDYAKFCKETHEKWLDESVPSQVNLYDVDPHCYHPYVFKDFVQTCQAIGKCYVNLSAIPLIKAKVRYPLFFVNVLKDKCFRNMEVGPF